MKSKITYIAALDTVFILFLVLSSAISTKRISDALYYLAFIIPISIGLYLIKRDKDIPKDAEELIKLELRIKKRNAIWAVPLVFPTIGTVCLVSFITSVIMTSLGAKNEVTIEEGLLLAILVHAFLPAFLEELLFRYIPMNLMAEEPKSAIIISSLFFAISHLNVFSIPYAAVAGILFSLIDIATRSVIPSFAIHFLNNFISILLIIGELDLILYIAIAALTLISLAAIYAKRGLYSNTIKESIRSNSVTIPPSAILFITSGLLLALLNL